MDHLHAIQQLRNTYYAMRHGRSVANDEGIIVSDPAQGVPGYGLSEEGRRQVESSVAEAMRNGLLDATTLIVTSDFARARQSAEIASEVLGAREIIVTPKLRERFFGKWEKQHYSSYWHVWERDALDDANRHDGVESTQDVLARTTSLVRDLERDYDGRTILLVSHGDPLQILQTAFERLDPSKHRLLPPLETAQIRKLELKPTRQDRKGSE
jgi:probable phosphoglycerate mutase